jgi:hypothetical protein
MADSKTIEGRRTELQPTVNRLLVTPKQVSRMLEERRRYQLVKFRTTCTDCVPNL